MNTDLRQLLYDKLMEGAPETPEALIMLEEVVTLDLEAIEPIIDDALEKARKGANPTDWINSDVLIDCIPDGSNCLLTFKVGERSFRVVADRTRMKTFGEFLIRESGL